jgi:ribosomal protein L7/L12
MSSGLYFVLGLVVGSVVTALNFLRARPRHQLGQKEDVSEETLARARELVAQGKIVTAVKAVRDETGWDLKRAKAVVDEIPRGRKDDGIGHYGGPS